MSRIQRELTASTALLAAIVATSGMAYAQAQPQAQASPSVQLEEVTVTATKRPERLQNVPVAVTALTSEVLQRSNVRELGDLVNLSPGLTINYGSQPGNFSINMRGIGTFSNGIAVESDVAVVLDDVPVGQQAQAFKDLVDVDRVEVLRGPQSTLFGKSAIAGVLNVTTSAPTSTLTGKVTALATNDDEQRVGFTVSGPIRDDLRFRLTVADSSFPGLLTNLTTGKKVGGSAGFSAIGKLQWKPTEDLTVDVSPRFNRNHSTCCESPLTSLTPGLFYQGIPQLPEATVLRGVTLDKNNTSIRSDDEPGGGNSVSAGVTGRISYAFSDASPLKGHTVQSITSYDFWKMRDYQDIDGTDSPLLLYFPVAQPVGIDGGASIHGYFHNRSMTQELRLTSPGDGRLRYVAGLWYARNDGDRYLNRGPGLSVAQYLAESTNINYAAFGSATFDVTSKLSLIGGLRYNHQYISYHFTNFLQPVGNINRDLGQRNDESSVTGNVGVQYKWTPNIMTYATYSTGYKGQAYDLVSTFNAKEAAAMPVPHETAKNYEIGFKSSLLNRRIYFNADLFNTEYYGFQTSVTSFLPDGTFLTFLNSIGQLQTRGLEVDSQARVTSNFSLNGSFAYTEATVVHFPNGPCYSGEPAAPAGGTIPAPSGLCYIDATHSKVQDLAGKRLNNAPRYKFNIGGEYDHSLGSLPFEGFVGFTYRWQSSVNFSLSQDPVTVQRAYGIANLNVGVNDLRRRYRVTFFANNLFDQRYANGLGNTTAGFSAPGITGHGTTWSVPRDAFRYFGARLDLNF